MEIIIFLDSKSQKKEELKKAKNFYDQLQKILEKTNKNNYTWFPGDLNTRTVIAEIHNIVGSFGEPVLKPMDFATYSNKKIMNSFYKHRYIYIHTHVEEWKTNLMSLAILFHFLCAQHVSDINISIFRSLRQSCWITTSVVLFSVRCVLEVWCGWFWVVFVPNLQYTTNWEQETDVVIQQHSRKLLMMDILMSETCWAHKKWNKIASGIKLVFHSSTITTMHGPINIRNIHMVSFAIPRQLQTISLQTWSYQNCSYTWEFAQERILV